MKTAEQLLKEKGIRPKTIYHNYDYVYRAVYDIIEQAQKEAYNEAWEHAIALRKRTGNPYNEREGKAMLDFEIEARKLKK